MKPRHDPDQLEIDWGQTPATPPLVQRLPWDFKTTFPAPREDAIEAGILYETDGEPVDEPVVQWELTRYLDDQWTPVLEKDVDGANSLPLALDRDNPNLGRYSACRRVSRTIYMGSAPTLRAAHRGIDDRQVKLYRSLPSVFDAALWRISATA